MLSVQEARAKVLEHARPLPAQTLALDPGVLGLVLAEDTAADLDMPPYDKSMMDGYAVRSADLNEGRRELRVIEEVSAGRTPRLRVESGQATRIMTGAPIPDGADAVVMVENTMLLDSGCVRINESPKKDQNILRRGKEMRAGDTILSKGARLRPQELGVLATIGRISARLQPRPAVSVLSTGDEIVEAPAKPGPGHIRNGNGPMLTAQASRADADVTYLGIARDTPDDLQMRIKQGLSADVLVLSGGVSAGKLDLVPGVLAESGVEPIFHKVAMKPGKPVFFGVHTRQSSRRGYVFGLPGNPVSAMVCFELFVRPCIQALMALKPGPRIVKATLTEDYAYRTDRPTYHPAVLSIGETGYTARAVPWFGSPDLRGVAAGNAFVIFPVGDHLHRAGTTLDVLVVE